MGTVTTTDHTDRGGGRTAVARVIQALAGLVALIIIAGILLVVLDADAGNEIVGAVLDAARWLVGPFKGLFDLSGQNLQIIVNWGLAAIVYLAVGTLIARLIAR